jgi:hypothetical protein
MPLRHDATGSGREGGGGGSPESEDLPLVDPVPLEEGGNVLHRPLVFAGAAVLALLLAVPALAVRVHVRVEGANATIFGPTEPLVTPVAGTFTPPEGAPVTLSADTAFGALERGSRIGEFYYRVQPTGFGPYVDRIGRLAATGTSGWVYKVNGVSPPVGADQYRLRAGDRVLWYHATFGPSGGPKTIDLRRRSRNCYRAVLRDDQGKATTAPVVFHVDGRRRRDSDGAVCLSGHWHTVRATAPGAVRSRVLNAPRRRHR